MSRSDNLYDATPDAIGAAAALLRDGRLVAFPTETVYGLGADATSDRAVAGIYAAKERPSFNPLISHVAELAMARRLGRFGDAAEALAAAFWPGPLTMVLPRTEDCPVSRLASAGLASIAIRLPAHPVAQALLAATGRPVVAPSANRSGQLSPTRAAHVLRSLGQAPAMILDGGACAFGLESTVVGLAGPEPLLLRPGAIAREAIEAVIGPLGRPATNGQGPSPGMMESHYAPAGAVRLGATARRAGEHWLGFGPEAAGADLNLSPSGDPVEAAANLFAMLHALDEAGASTIAVSPVPDVGLGVAINDRLRRAAAPRP
ncbi:L-threonylcarbamoyladenylate synthase [Oceanibacterium hippocampi]|uniref:Threonylcarbamoyl-AMP synthase n=1 Tax=Oceanibacterium hippocampi TaxID=745714 RepID=A0A1Y5SBF4_9PROT|nr:L-threonylcarbamoyladenylate synthase [Oceanibacterium hippocampi]SLN35779.1 Threonylcarbamoyl-AMP synthase [Oceanibacterium hippocampi]